METKDLRYFAISSIENIHLYGRTGRDASGAVALFWTASGFAVNSPAQELWAELEADYDNLEPWVSVWVNGCQVSRFIVEKGRRWYCLFRTVKGSKVNRISLLKETQAMSDDASHSLLLHALAVPAAEQRTEADLFRPLPEKRLRLEVIGDSLTTGEGIAGAVDEMDWIPAWQALKDNYAVLTAQKLDADLHILSQSGWGVVASWDNDRWHCLPRYYEQTCGLANGAKNISCGAHEPWNFSLWKSDVVVVNLGTNDWGAFKNPPFKDPATGTEWKMRLDGRGKPLAEDLRFLQRGVTDFLSVLRRCNPAAHIIWIYGMCSFDLGSSIRGAVEDFAESRHDAAVHFLRVPCMCDESAEEKGSRQHPGWGTHRRVAQALAREIEGWVL